MKAQYIYDHYHVSCFADDTGLEVEALNGAPGVYSARYASMAVPNGSPIGIIHDTDANMARLLRDLANNNNRNARFRTVIALVEEEEEFDTEFPLRFQNVKYFEGIVEGTIAYEKSGHEGLSERNSVCAGGLQARKRRTQTDPHHSVNDL